MKNEVIDVLEGLKNRKLDWYVYGDNSMIHFKAEIKNVMEGALDSIHIKFKKGALDYLNLNYPWTCEKEEDEKKLRYKIATHGRTKVLVCYFKREAS